MDLATEFNTDHLSGDLVLSGGALLQDEGLQTAVLHSLFTDRRALADDVLPEGVNRRGWWADLTLPAEGDQYGSRLWLLFREKQTAAVLRRAEEYAEEALAWLITDGVASQVKVAAEVVRRGVLGLSVEIRLARGNVFVEQYLLTLGG
ncbi:MAG: hypothetical protein C4525_03185 [Desulfarculus sp.]|nr:MAG: hypothetical protein C4525_03185 [Desulfarculus sp.]